MADSEEGGRRRMIRTQHFPQTAEGRFLFLGKRSFMSGGQLFPEL